jgi:hypothetical protein
MKIISTKVHGVLDYLSGLFFIAAPWIFHFAGKNAETRIISILGLFAIVYSLFTYYEWGVVKVIRMRVHLAFDAVLGLILLTSPWILTFDNNVKVVYVCAGLFALIVAILSDPIPGRVTSHRSLTEDDGIHDFT